MGLPFPPISIPPPSTLKVDLEAERKKAMERKEQDLKIIEPYKNQIEKIYSQTWCIDRAMLKMEKAGVPKIVRQTWFIMEANKVRGAVMIKRITSH